MVDVKRYYEQVAFAGQDGCNVDMFRPVLPADTTVEDAILALSDSETVKAWIEAGRPDAALVVALGITAITDGEQIQQISELNQASWEKGGTGEEFAADARELIRYALGRGVELEDAAKLLVRPIHDVPTVGHYNRHANVDGRTLLEESIVDPGNAGARLLGHLSLHTPIEFV